MPGRHQIRRRSRVRVCQASLAGLENLEPRRLFAVTTGTLIGISGNQQNDAYEDETLYQIDYALPGTTSGPFLDGWEDVKPNPPDAVLSLSNTVGVSQGSGALRVEIPNSSTAGYFWGIRSPNVVDLLKAGATTLSYDMTLIGQELNGGSFDPASGGIDNG